MSLIVMERYRRLNRFISKRTYERISTLCNRYQMTRSAVVKEFHEQLLPKRAWKLAKASFVDDYLKYHEESAKELRSSLRYHERQIAKLNARTVKSS